MVLSFKDLDSLYPHFPNTLFDCISEQVGIGSNIVYGLSITHSTRFRIFGSLRWMDFKRI